jgi:hypothetical protein
MKVEGDDLMRVHDDEPLLHVQGKKAGSNAALHVHAVNGGATAEGV